MNGNQQEINNFKLDLFRSLDTIFKFCKHKVPVQRGGGIPMPLHHMNQRCPLLHIKTQMSPRSQEKPESTIIFFVFIFYSTVSSGLNGLAAVTLIDIIRPIRKWRHRDHTLVNARDLEGHDTKISKILSKLFYFLCHSTLMTRYLIVIIGPFGKWRHREHAVWWSQGI